MTDLRNSRQVLWMPACGVFYAGDGTADVQGEGLPAKHVQTPLGQSRWTAGGVPSALLVSRYEKIMGNLGVIPKSVYSFSGVSWRSQYRSLAMVEEFC